jgi:TBC1 domain family member 2A
MSLPEKRTTKTRDFVDKVLHWTHVTYSGSMKRLLHDTKSRQEECIGVDQLDVDGDVDGYGFERFPSSSLSSSSTSPSVTSNDVGRVLHTCLRHERYQSRLWNQVDVYAVVADDKTKRLCRGGVPPHLRKHVWFALSGGCGTKKYYEHTLGMTYSLYIERGKLSLECMRQIDLDVPRTFPNNQWIQGSVGQVSLQRVLYAFSGIHQEVGYCQGMNYIAGMLLLVLEYNEEMAFWTMCGLIGHDVSPGILYKDMYASSLSGCHVEMRTLESIVAKKLPNLAEHMKMIECDFSMVSTEWFLCLFATSLPLETVARVWDVLFCEGPKILYRIALAILKIHEEELLATENSGDLVKALHFACALQFDRDALLSAAFQDIGPLSMSRINKIRDEKQLQVDKETALRETKDRIRAAVEEHGHVLLQGTGEDDLLRSSAGDLESQPKVFRSPLFLKKYFKKRM